MKLMKDRKAFTIVEMVIVIAVIAILATVLVPTISGVIDKANHSADQQFVASLNIQLALWQVDNSQIENESDLREAINSYYGEEGEDFYASLAPKSANRGYHFWFSAADQQVVLAKYEDLLDNVAPTAEVEPTFSPASPRSLIINDKNYFLMDQAGSAIIDELNVLENLSDPQDYVDMIDRLTTGDDLAKLVEAKISETAVVTEYGVFRYVTPVGSTDVVNYVYISAEVGKLNKVEVYTYDPSVKDADDGSADARITTNTNIKIELPEGVKVNAFGFTGFKNDTDNSDLLTATPELFVNTTEDKLSEVFEAYATDCVIVLPNGSRYVVDGVGIYKLPRTNGDQSVVGTLNTDSVEKIEIQYNDGNSVIGDDAGYFYNGTLYLAYDFASAKLSLSDGVSAGMVNWTLSDNAPIQVDNSGNITVVGNPDPYKTTATVTATLKGDVTKADTINVQLIFPTQVSWKLSDTTYSAPATNKAFELIYTAETEFALSFAGLGYAQTGSEYVKMNATDLAIQFATSGNLFRVDNNNKLVLDPSKIKDTPAQTLTVTYGTDGLTYVTETYTITVIDNSSTPFEVNNITSSVKMGQSYLFRVGNENPFTLNKLFNTEKAPVNVTLKIYDAAKTSGTGVRGEIATSGDGVFKATYTSNLTKDNWATSNIQFTGTGVAIIEITTDKGSATLAVEVVNGKNVTSAGHWVTDMDLILLSNIKLTSQKAINGYKLYGNGMTIYTDASFASNSALISVTNGTLDNVIITGPVYPKVEYNSTDGKKYYGPGVETYGTSTISNSYISGFRSPVKTSKNSATTTITNTTLSGGVYANLDVDGGNIVLVNLTTEQKIVSAPDGTQVVGGGIVFASGAVESSEITIGGYLKQYNWFSSEIANKLPSEYKTAINSMLQETKFVHNIGGENYVNAGIIFQGVRTKDIMDIRDDKSTVPYSKINKTVYVAGVGITGTLYTYDNSKGNAGAVNYGGYVPTAQTPINPEMSYAPTLTKPTGSDYTASYSDKKITIGIPAGGSFTIDLAQGLSFSKYETLMSFSKIEVNGVALERTTSYTFNQKGTYIITYTMNDNLSYDNFGKQIDPSISNPCTYTTAVEVTITNIPDAIIESVTINNSHFYRHIGVGFLGLDPDYFAVVPVADSITVKDYDEATGQMVSKTYTAAEILSSNKFTVTVSGGHYSGSNTSFIKHSNKPYIHCAYEQDKKEAYDVTVVYTYTGYTNKSDTELYTYSFMTSTSATTIKTPTAWS